jgi:hypothetical protein
MTNAKLHNIEVMNIVKLDKLTKQRGGKKPQPHTKIILEKKKDLKILLKKTLSEI